MAIEIKYSEKLANVEAGRVRLKCSWADLCTLDITDNKFRKILLTVKNPTFGYMEYKITASYKSIYNDKEMVGIATGNYCDLYGERYIEIRTIPPTYLMTDVVSKEWIYNEWKNSIGKNTLSLEQKAILKSMYEGKGYDKNKYKLTYTIPATAWVRLKSIILYTDKNLTVDSTTILENKPTNKSALLLGLGLLALNM